LAAVASAGDGVQTLSTTEASSEPDQQQEAATESITDAEPMEDAATDTAAAAAAAAASTSGSAKQASSITTMDTEPTDGAAASTHSRDERPSELPFQVQITYMDLDGAEAMRVLTQTQPVTRDRQQAETSRFYSLSLFFCLFVYLV